MKKIAMFDLDGTLVNSMSRFSAGILTILDENGITYDTDEMISITTPLGYKGTAEYFISIGVKGTVEELIKQMSDNLINEYTNNIYLKPFVKEYLLKLKSEGYSLYVLTASPHIVTDPCLKHNGVFDLFTEVWSIEDFGIPKTDIKLFYEVADKLDCKAEEILFFDDNDTAVVNSVKAGYKTIGVRDTQTEKQIDLIKKTASRFIESFEEML